ncbi:MAG: TolB family protein [Kordiimonas sp.]
MKTYYLPCVLAMSLSISASAETNLSTADNFLGLTPPTGDEVKMLHPDIISTKEGYELNAVFSPDGKEFYFCRVIDDVYRLFRIKLGANGEWSKPERIHLKQMDEWEIVDPWISPDNQRMYYISNAPTPSFAEKSVNIWVMKRKGNEWGIPEVLVSPLNSDANEIYPMPVDSGNIYFNSSRDGGIGSRDIYVIKATDGADQAINLGKPVNSEGREGDVFVAPDEKYLIVTSEKEGGYGGADMYISTRLEDGSWSDTKNLGTKINSTDHDYTPSVSPDGKYFFFTRGGDIFWTSTEHLGIPSSKRELLN